MRGSLPRSVLLILFAAQIALAQSGDGLKALEKEIEAIKQRQLAVEKDLQEIKALLPQGFAFCGSCGSHRTKGMGEGPGSARGPTGVLPGELR